MRGIDGIKERRWVSGQGRGKTRGDFLHVRAPARDVQALFFFVIPREVGGEAGQDGARAAGGQAKADGLGSNEAWDKIKGARLALSSLAAGESV